MLEYGIMSNEVYMRRSEFNLRDIIFDIRTQNKDKENLRPRYQRQAVVKHCSYGIRLNPDLPYVLQPFDFLIPYQNSEDAGISYYLLDFDRIDRQIFKPNESFSFGCTCLCYRYFYCNSYSNSSGEL